MLSKIESGKGCADSGLKLRASAQCVMSACQGQIVLPVNDVLTTQMNDLDFMRLELTESSLIELIGNKMVTVKFVEVC